MVRVLRAAAFIAAFFSVIAPALCATGYRAMPCSDGSLRAVASRTHTKLTPCVASPHKFVLETTYYQNASRYGGTALAAYPEARIRYGVAAHWELFVDTPSEIAKSGERGRGIYVMTPAGYGVKYEFARLHNVVYSVSAESHPPLGAMQNLNLSPLSDVHLSGNWSGAHGREFGFEAGLINYESVQHQHLHATSLFAASLTQTIDPLTAVTFELATQSHVYPGSRSQTSGVVSVQRVLSPHLLFNVELGTAFNVSANNKPHYLGAGFTIH